MNRFASRIFQNRLFPIFFSLFFIFLTTQINAQNNCNPINLTASQGPGFKTITLNWNGIGPSQHGYEIWMRQGNGTYSQIGSTTGFGGQNISFAKTDLDTNQTYTFYVVTGICGPPPQQSNEASATTLDFETPGFLAVTGLGMNEVQFHITGTEGVDFYYIYGKPSTGTTFGNAQILNIAVGNNPPLIYTLSAPGVANLETFKNYDFYLKAKSGTREKDTAIQTITTRDIDKPQIDVRIDLNRKVHVTWAAVPNAQVHVLQKWSYGFNQWFEQNGISYDPQTQSFSFTEPISWVRPAEYRVIAVRDSRQRISDSKKAAYYEDQGLGESSCRTAYGKPVNISNGNMYLMQTDYTLPGIGEAINVTRTYNSLSSTVGYFGLGWSTVYDEHLTKPWNDEYELRLAMPDGRAVYFSRRLTTEPFTPTTVDFYGEIVKNTDGTYNLTFKDGRVHQFDALGKLVWLKDRNGNQTNLNYNSTNGHLTAITDAFGRTLNVETNANGSIWKIWDSFGTINNPVAVYVYDPNNASLLKSVTYLDGSKYDFIYDSNSAPGKILLKTVKDALGNVLETHDYDAQGRATTSGIGTVQGVDGAIEKYIFDYSNPAFAQVTDALGRVTKVYIDKTRGRNFAAKTEGFCNCGGSGSEVVQYFYDDRLNMVKKVDALNRETLYTYDSNGNRLSMTDVLGTENYTYNSFGEVLTKTDRMGGVTTNTYDTNGNLLTTKDALNQLTTLTYTTRGQLATVKDALNQTSVFTYDTSGRLTEVKDADNKTTNYAYDLRARLTSVTNALGQTTQFEYDLHNRPKKVIHADTTFMTYGYDLAGRRTTVTDERGNPTTYGYDNAYRLISVTDALSHATTYSYDLMSNLTAQTDALGNTTNYEYEDFNRLKKVIYPAATTGGARLEERLEYDLVGNPKKRIDTANRETLYEYDNANRLIKTTDALGQMTQFEYNARSQMEKVKDALNQEYVFIYDALGRQLSQTRAGATMSFEYDAVGNRTKRTDYAGRETTYEYDVLNRLKKINYLSATNPVPILTANYSYDGLSRLTSATNENGTVGFTYDLRGRVKTSTDVFNHQVEYNYDAASNRTQLKLDGAVHTTYNYDAANRLTQLTDEASQNFTFAYDIAKRLTSRSSPNGVTTTIDYDGMSRLTRLKDATSTTTLFDRQLGYNTANQISQIAEPSQTRNFGYDNVDRLTSMTNGTSNESYAFDGVGNRTSSHLSSTYNYQPFNRVTATVSANYNYDANGNMTTKAQGKELWRYAWDYENRLVSASTRKQTVRYKYDALGRRIQRYFVGGRENTKFIYDGLDVVMDDNSGVLTKYQNGLGIDNKLKLSSNGVSKYFLADHLGSTNALTDSSGNILESTNYDSFGNAVNQLSTRYAYTGREFDSFTGLHFYRARWFDGNLGRFISEDPIGFAGGDVNLYGYVRNNSISYIDPSGLEILAIYYRDERRLLVWDLDLPHPNPGPDYEFGDLFSGRNKNDQTCNSNPSDEGCCKNNPSCDAVKNYGPIPYGAYAIDKDTNKSGEGWRKISYRLYRRLDGQEGVNLPDGRYAHNDSPIFDPASNKRIPRGGFYLHPGSVSWGCVTFPYAKRQEYDQLSGVIKQTSASSFYDDENKKRKSGGWLFVY